MALTQQGIVQGDMWTSRGGRYFNVFRGIPYAKQPTGARRFRRTESLDEKDSWLGVRVFNIEMQPCYQFSPLIGIFVGSEECLMLNVYSPNLELEKPLPVMVWIHGGGFVAGEAGSTTHGPQYLMDQDIVLVTFNYRLGILGFLSMETEDIPGNQGLWDQREALLWVQKNIKHFGGDPKRVTIFGGSAGSMSVNYHLFSTQSKGLFHRAIMQSGTAISPYTKVNNPPAHYAMRLSRAVGCSGADVSDCLRNIPVNTLYNNIMMFDECSLRADIGLTFPGPWVPVVDNYVDKPFIAEAPEDILETGKENKVPTMIGFTKEDGLLFTSRFIKDKDFKNFFLENWESCGPINLLGKETSFITKEDVAYVNNLRDKYPKDLTDLFTDAIFARSSHIIANKFSQRNKHVYKYIFSYKGNGTNF